MDRRRIIAFVFTVIFAAALVVAAQGYVVILKSGHKIRCKEPMQIQGPNAILTLATGTVAAALTIGLAAIRRPRLAIGLLLISLIAAAAAWTIARAMHAPANHISRYVGSEPPSRP